METELGCGADTGNQAMTAAFVGLGETVYVVVDGSYDPDSVVQGQFTLDAEIHAPPSIMVADLFINQQVQLVAASYQGMEGTLPIAGAEFVFLDNQGNVVTMNGSPGPFLTGDTPESMGGNNVEGVAYLPINFTQAELDSVASVEFYLYDSLDQFSGSFNGMLSTPQEVTLGDECDPRQGINVCEGNSTCFTNDPNTSPTCQ